MTTITNRIKNKYENKRKSSGSKAKRRTLTQKRLARILKYNGSKSIPTDIQDDSDVGVFIDLEKISLESSVVSRITQSLTECNKYSDFIERYSYFLNIYQCKYNLFNESQFQISDTDKRIKKIDVILNNQEGNNRDSFDIGVQSNNSVALQYGIGKSNIFNRGENFGIQASYKQNKQKVQGFLNYPITDQNSNFANASVYFGYYWRQYGNNIKLQGEGTRIEWSFDYIPQKDEDFNLDRNYYQFSFKSKKSNLKPQKNVKDEEAQSLEQTYKKEQEIYQLKVRSRPLIQPTIFEDADFGKFKRLLDISGSLNYEKNSLLPYWKLKFNHYLTGQLFQTSGPSFCNRFKFRGTGALNSGNLMVNKQVHFNQELGNTYFGSPDSQNKISLGFHNTFKLFLDTTIQDVPYLHYSVGAVPEIQDGKLNWKDSLKANIGCGYNIALDKNILNISWNFFNINGAKTDFSRFQFAYEGF